MLSVKMLYRALLIDCRYLSFPARVSVTSQEIWDGGGLRNCPRHFMCITCSSRSKVSFRLHEFCDSGKLVHEKKQSIVHVRISHWSTSLVLCASFYRCLQKFVSRHPIFLFEKRGAIQMKGRDEPMVTYILNWHPRYPRKPSVPRRPHQASPFGGLTFGRTKGPL